MEHFIEWLCIVIWPLETAFGIFMIFYGGLHVDPNMQDAEFVSILVNGLYVMSYISASICFYGSLEMLKEEREFYKSLRGDKN